MSSENDISWNMKPKSGITAFFTDETFSKWTTQDTHESRLQERLARLGISPPPPLSGSVLLPAQKLAKETTDYSTVPNQIRSYVKGQSCAARTVSGSKSHDKEPESKLEIKDEFSIQSDFYHVKTATSSHESKLIKAFNENQLLRIEPTAPQDFDHSNENKAENQQGNVFGQTKNLLMNPKVEPVTHVTAEEASKTSETALDTETEFVRPFSFYKEGVDEEINVEAEEESTQDDIEVANKNDIEDRTDSEQNSVRHSSHTVGEKAKLGDTGSVFKPKEDTEKDNDKQAEYIKDVTEMSEEERKAYEAKMEEEERKAQKEVMNKNKMFFNIKDRHAEKYFPVVYNRKPWNRRSKLTCQEQRLYIELARRYGNLNAYTPEIHDDNFKQYLAMKVTVNKEQELFQDYLKSVALSCKKDYEYIHPEVEKYASSRYLAKKMECFKYPRFYSSIDKIVLTDEIPDTPPTLQYVRPVLELGSVSKLVLPNIMPGMPQPCVTTNFQKINELCPILKGVYKGTYVWNKVVCSQDPNAEQLAVPNKCDIVMSSSSVRRLIDNQGKLFKYWDMPFTVREYQIKDGEKTTLHKVVYIDKPLIRQSQYIPKDRIQLYQKHAIRACAIRSNVRGHVFCGIKPVHELVKLPTLEELEEEMKQCEERLKESVNPNALQDDEAEAGETGKMDLRKRKRKHGQVGMFDLEKDIDDLETFGMDSFLGSKSKGEGSKSSPDKNPVLHKTEHQETAGKSVRKGKKSADDDLELLKNELKGIKTTAIRESFKQQEMYKDMYIQENNNESPSTSGEQGLSDNNKTNRGNEEGVEKSDVEQNEMEQESEMMKETSREDGSDSVPRNTHRNKNNLLSVKNMSSLTEKMKQMSTIKSKLMQRTHGQELESHPPTIDTAGPSQKKTQLVNSCNILNHPVNKSIEETATVLKLDQNESDSDSEGEGLVIDVPSESPRKTSDNSANSIHYVMPLLERITDNTSNIKTNKSDNQSVSSESEFGSPKLIIAVEEAEEEAKVKSRVTKRRSTSDIPENVSVPKRVLRSASNRETADSAKKTTEIQPIEKKQLDSEYSNLDDSIGKKSVTSHNVRGRKRELQSVSTRSRSASSESQIQELGTSFATKSRRVTRSSASLVVDSKEEQVDETVPVKRGRGRKKKNELLSNKGLKKEKMLSEEADNALEISKTTVAENHPLKQIEVNLDMNIEIDRNSKSPIEEVNDFEGTVQKSEEKYIDNEEEIARTRNRNKVRKLESDESEEHSRDGHEDIHHDKSGTMVKKNLAKKDFADLEAKKIKEMAEAMKKKISEAKNKQREDKRRKSRESTGSDKPDDGVENKLVHVSDKKDNVSATEQKSSNSEEKINLGKSNKSGLDKELENILKSQDQGHGSNKGSLAEVFTRNHGMTHCGFPMDDNVTYHQWNLSGTNVLIRCKYHGFISGQGLVHISPKIEYQPNFGFEQDTVSEICKNWISIYVRPNSSLVKARINPFNSEIMMFENVAYKDLIQPDSLFKPEQAFTDLHVILNKLKRLPVGQYLLKNNPRKDQFTVMKAVEQETSGNFDLHLKNSSVMKYSAPSSIQWTPIDNGLMLPHQKKMNFIPCTFPPKDAKVGEKKPPQRNKKKKKRRNRDKDS